MTLHPLPLLTLGCILALAAPARAFTTGPVETLRGDGTNERLGEAVVMLGDLDDDGLSEWAVGAPSAGSGGQVLVQAGTASTRSRRLATLDALLDFENFGGALAAPGDVDGDGVPDLLVGASAANGGQGRAYLYSGATLGQDPPLLVIDGEAALDYFGLSVAGPGDLDGDGHADFVVAAPLANSSGNDAGRVYVYRGGPGLDGIADYILDGEGATSTFGYPVAGAGDVDGDGHTDLLIGAGKHDLSGTDRGRAYLFLGGPGLDSTPDLVLDGEAAGDRFGGSLAGVGDFDRDGHADFAVGAFLHDANGSASGRVYFYRGGSPLPSNPHFTLDGRAAGEYFGLALGATGDFDGDGYADFAAGAPQADGARGRVEVFQGNPRAEPVLHVEWPGNRSGQEYGLVLAGGTDATGDGRDDLLVGTPDDNLGEDAAGRADLRVSPAAVRRAGDVTLRRLVVGEQEYSDLGATLAGADFDGDGWPDLALGAPDHDGDYDNGGRVELLPDAIRLAEPPWLVLDGTRDYHYRGRHFATADLDGDGHQDLLEAYRNPQGAPQAEHYLRFHPGDGQGGFGPSVESPMDYRSWVFYGVWAGTDLDGDGQADFLTTSSRHEGEAHASIYRGGADLDLLHDFVIEDASVPRLGYAATVSTDVDGDGHPDILLGTGEPSLHVYRAGAALDSIVDHVIPLPFEPTAIEVGDFDGDGHDDIAVGHPYETAVVYLGGPGLDGLADWIADVPANPKRFSEQLLFSDADGDGIDDLWVADAWAGVTLGVQDNFGRFSIFHGGPGADTSPDVAFEGVGHETNLGSSLAALGPVPDSGLQLVAAGGPFFTLVDDGHLYRAGSAHVFESAPVDLVAPLAGHTWASGRVERVRWLGETLVDLRLSTDGGGSWTTLATGVGGQRINDLEVEMPALVTTQARVELVPADPADPGLGSSRGDFTLLGATPTGTPGERFASPAYLGRPRPNPAASPGSVVFPVQLGAAATVELRVFDARGRRVHARAPERLEAGTLHLLRLPGREIAAGVYSVQLWVDGRATRARPWVLLP